MKLRVSIRSHIYERERAWQVLHRCLFVCFRNFMNDALRTSAFVRFEPETIACACIYLAARVLQIPLPSKPHWFLLFGATKEDIKEICINTMKLYSREKPNSEQLERQVEKRKFFLEEARLKAKGQNPNGTPALATIGGFSPASKPSSPRDVKMEDKSPNSKLKESENRQLFAKSPLNGSIKKEDGKVFQNGKNHSRSRSRSTSRSPHRHRRSHSGTYSSHSSHSPSPRQKARRSSPISQLRTDRDRPSETSRHANKRRRSRSRSRSNSRERARDRDYAKHKQERSSSGHHWDHRDRERDRSHDHGRNKHQSRSHSGHSHSRHRR